MPLKIVLCSSCKIGSLKLKKKLSGLHVFYSGSNESSLASQFKWLDSTFKCLRNFFKSPGGSLYEVVRFVNFPLLAFRFVYINDYVVVVGVVWVVL
jgi:hypothetical protein